MKTEEKCVETAEGTFFACDWHWKKAIGERRMRKTRMMGR